MAQRPRIQVDRQAITGQTQARPMAAPTQTFVRTDGGQELSQLAEGLAQFNPSLRRFSETLAQRTAEEKQAEGEAAARELVRQGLSLAEATRQGKLPKQDNPWFMAGFKEQMGRGEADRWRWKLIEDIAKDPDLQESTDVGDFEEFANTHRQKWIEENFGGDKDGFIEKGFGARADAYINEEGVKFASRIEDRLDKKSDEAHFAEVKQHVVRMAGKASPEEIAQEINLLVRNQFALGQKEKQLDRTTVSAVIAAAMEVDDFGETALQVLKHVKGSKSGLVLGDTPFGTAAMDKAKEEIINRVWTRNQRDHVEAQRNREEMVRGIMGDALLAKAADPNADLKPLIAKVAKVDPEAVQKLLAFDNAVDGLTFRTDEYVRKELFAGIWNPGIEHAPVTESDIVYWRTAGKLTTEDAAWLIGQIRSARDSGREKETGIYADFQFRNELGNIKGQFMGQLGEMSGESNVKAAFAEAMFVQRWALLNQDPNKKLGESEKAKWLSDTAQEVVRIAKGPDVLQIGSTPPPQFEGAGNEQTDTNVLLLDEVDLRQYMNGRRTPKMEKTLNDLGLSTPSARGAFLKNQLKLFMNRNGGRMPRSVHEGTEKKEE